MEPKRDKILLLAEELTQARQIIEKTMLTLKGQMVALRERLDISIEELDMRGMDSQFRKLGHVHEQGSSIDRLVKELKQQSSIIEQAIGHVKSTKNISSV